MVHYVDIKNFCRLRLIVGKQCIKEIGEGGQKVQTCSYKITPGDVKYNLVTMIFL